MRKCAICGAEFAQYEPLDRKYLDEARKYGRQKETRPELLNREEYSCPYCYAADRDRMIIAFLKLLRGGANCELNVLEIAPSGALQRYLFSQWGKCNLYTADLFMKGVDYQADIQDMREIEDESFDLIVCSHVLEHVRDDRKAMRELCRVLDQRGLGIILVPLDLNQTFTDEEWGLSEEENWRRFGQGDHVRAYNKNEYVSRLQECGFCVHELGKEFFGSQVFEENALTDSSVLYLVYKNRMLYENKEKMISHFAKAHENADLFREYQVADESCEYWIDLCAIEDETLKIWGWAFVRGVSSERTKFKLLLAGEEEDFLIGIHIREREDIQSSFGTSEMNYAFSGIDVILPVTKIASGNYHVYLLLANGTRRYRIHVKDHLVIDRGKKDE